MAAKRWCDAATIAMHLATVNPEGAMWWINWAYATRRHRGIPEAKQILLDAEKIHPGEAMIKFNLGCYACQTGNIEEAFTRVKRAIELDGDLRATALDDPDLEPLWSRISVAVG